MIRVATYNLVMDYVRLPKYYPTRSALHSLCITIPTESGVQSAARLYCIKAIKAAKIGQQISFLEKCQKSQVFPKTIQNQNQVNIFEDRKLHIMNNDSGRRSTQSKVNMSSGIFTETYTAQRARRV